MSRRWALGAGVAALAAAAGCSAEPAGGSPPTGAPTSSTGSGPSASASPSTSPSTSPSPSPSTSPSASPSATSTPTPELPRGGTAIFPEHRLVGYCGYPGSPALGRLGSGELSDRVAEVERRGEAYAAGRTVLPVLELIGTIVQGSPGSDGKWRTRAPEAIVERYLEAARDAEGLLLINIQPGRSDFLTECRHFADYLAEPDVGVALDPEWAMHAGQVPGRAYGWTTGAELNEVAGYLADLVSEHRLPEKVMVFHQVAASVVRQESGLKGHDGVAIVKSVDGLGPGGAKKNTYRVLTDDLRKAVHPGFKLFFEEDTRGSSTLMTPKEVLGLDPRPEYVMYE